MTNNTNNTKNNPVTVGNHVKTIDSYPFPSFEGYIVGKESDGYLVVADEYFTKFNEYLPEVLEVIQDNR
jgi:hypothetical protein